MRIVSVVGLAVMGVVAACSASDADDGDRRGSAGSGADATGGLGGNFGLGSGGQNSSGTGVGGGCGESTFGNEVSGSLLVVLDRSGSMSDSAGNGGTSKWAATVSAINAMTAAASPQLEMGVLPFPAGNFDGGGAQGVTCFLNPSAPGCDAFFADFGCKDVAMSPAVAIAPLAQNAGTISGWLAGESPGGNTPTLYALKYGYDIIRAHPTNGQRFVLLITDGEPTVATPAMLNLPAMATACEDLAAIEAEVGAAAAASPGVNTFVIGSPGSEGAASFLSQLALNGNTAKSAGCSAAAGDCHYQIGSANFEQELAMALQDIAGQISDCVFELPIDEDTDPNLVNVTVDTPDGTVDVYKDVTHQDGWDYTDGSQTKIQLFGPVCELYKQTPGNQVNIILGCPTVVK